MANKPLGDHVDDVDDISINSTESEAYSDDREFSVERVLAERLDGSKKQYLLSWTGYPEHKSTWEPKKNVQAASILEEWAKRQMLEKEGTETPYDIAKFDTLVAKAAEEKQDRHRRRKAKRKKQGIPVSPSGSGSEYSVEATEIDGVYDEDVGLTMSGKAESQKTPARAPPQTLKYSNHDVRVNARGEEKKRGSIPRASVEPARPISHKPLAKPKHRKSISDSSSDTPLANKRPRPLETQQPSVSSSNVPSAQRPLQKRPLPGTLSMTANPSVPVKNLLRIGPSVSARGAASTRGASSSARGTGATRGASSLAARNMSTKARPSLLQNAMDPTKAPKPFSNMRFRRKAELQSRAIADAALDLSALPGGLFDPSKPELFQPLKPSDLRKAKVSKGDSDSGILFDDQGTHVQSESSVQTLTTAEVARPPPNNNYYRHPDPSRAVCFYWDKNKRDPSQPDCDNGYTCKYIHEYERGVPIAHPPPGWVPKETQHGPASDSELKPLTCYYWDRFQKGASMSDCTKGFSCAFLHAYEHGLEIANAPGNYPKKVHPDRERATCYYWDLGMRQPGKSGCSRGDKCDFQHESRIGIPVALPSRFSSRINREVPPESPSLLGGPSTQASLQEPGSPTSWKQPDPNLGTCSNRDQSFREFGKGDCPRGEACKYIHEHGNGLPIAPAQLATDRNDRYRKLDQVNVREELMDVDQPEPEPDSSWPRSHGDTIALEPSSPQINRWPPPMPPFNETDPSNAVCYFWATKNKCSWDTRCKYIHSNDPNLPVAPCPKSLQTVGICKFWLRNDCYQTAESCKYIHKSATLANSPTSITGSNAIPLPPPSEDVSVNSATQLRRKKSVKFAMDEDDPMPFFDDLESTSAAKEQRDNMQATGSSRQAQIGSHQITENSKTISEPEHRIPRELNHQTQPQIDESIKERAQAQVPAFESLVTNISPVEIPKVKKTTINLDYRRSKVLQARGDRAKEVTFGSSEAQSVLLDFGDLAQVQHLQWGQDFSALSRIRFNQTCTAQDFNLQFSSFQHSVSWHGNLDPADLADTVALKAIDTVVEDMRFRSSGLVSVSPSFVVLIYPKSTEWDFIQALNDGPKDNRLRYFVFECTMDIKKPTDMRQVEGLTPYQYRKVLVKMIQGPRFKDMLRVYKNGKLNPFNFYLLFPPSANQTAEYLMSWLLQSCHGCKIYSSQIEGSWDFFVHGPSIESGVVFIHESAAANIYKLPSFLTLLKKTMSFWFISDSMNPYPIYPSSYNIPDDINLGQIDATRLFPHGHAFLLTPSFIVAEPQATYELLEWFFGRIGKPATGDQPEILKRRGKLDSTTRGTWKLVACHNLSDYLLDLANAKAREKKAFEAENHGKPSTEAMIEAKGLSFSACMYRYNIHAMIVELQSSNLLNRASDNDDDFLDSIDELYHPVIYADPEIDQNNEEALVDWFATWSLRKLDAFRKFTVVGSNADPGSIARASRIVEFAETKALETIPSAAVPITNVQKFAVTKEPPPNKGKDVQSITNHGIDQLGTDALKFVAITGASAKDAEEFLGQANNNVQRAIQLYHDRNDPKDVEAQILGSIATSRPAKMPLKCLPITNSDMAYANDTLASISISSTPHFLVVNPTTIDEQFFSPQFDGPPDKCFPGQKDGTRDERPNSSGTDRNRSSSSHVQIDKNGNKFVPSSVRHGYVPHGDGELYKNSQGMDKVVRHEIANVSGDLRPGSGEETYARKEHEKEVAEKMVLREIKFEPTEAWYKRLRNGGGGWEHISVEGWNSAFVGLGVNKR